MSTGKTLASDFFIGIREALTCPDVSVREYEAVMAHAIDLAIEQEREACAKLMEAMIDEARDPLDDKFWSHGWDVPLLRGAAAIRARK